MVWEHIWLSLVDPELEARMREYKFEKLTVTDQVLTILGQLRQRLLFGFPEWWLQDYGQSTIFIYDIATVQWSITLNS